LGIITINDNWKNIFRFLISFIFVTGAFGYFGGLIVGVDVKGATYQENSNLQNLIIALFELAGTSFIVWVFCKYVDHDNIINTFYLKKRQVKSIIGGILTGFLIMLIGFCLLLLLKQIEIVHIQYRIFDLLLSSGFFIAIAFTEEIAIRGYVLNKLLDTTSKYTALIISSIIFSLLHALNPNITVLSFINLFLAGIFLGITYIYTKNLWFPIALHFSWNFFQGPVFGFSISGMRFYSIIVQRPFHNNILNGGTFGFEGSLICVLLQVIGILMVFRIFKNHNKS
jgi:membrane protease YdiL (CAAX protease family)